MKLLKGTFVQNLYHPEVTTERFTIKYLKVGIQVYLERVQLDIN